MKRGGPSGSRLGQRRFRRFRETLKRSRSYTVGVWCGLEPTVLSVSSDVYDLAPFISLSGAQAQDGIEFQGSRHRLRASLLIRHVAKERYGR
jgi:hypothetical protein